MSDTYLDKNGKFHFNKTNPICYSHGCYYALGEKLGSFGYSVKKKKQEKRNKKEIFYDRKNGTFLGME